MELSLREWMFVAGVALILIIGLDALRRTLIRRREEERLMRAASSERQEPHADFGWLKELPNGGARVVNRDGTEADIAAADPVLDVATQAQFESPLSQSPEAIEEPDNRQPENDVIDEVRESSAQGTVDDLDDSAGREVPSDGVSGADAGPKEAGKAPLVQGQTVDWLDTLEPDDEPEPESDDVLVESPPEHVLLIHVKAAEGSYYSGEALLPLLLACDLRFGDLGFFHRHEQSGGKGAIQFSVANMLKPGVFDIDNMAGIQTQGIVFFMRVPGPKDLLTAYEAMLETARALVRHLGGQLLDQSHSVLTKQAIEQDKLLLRDYARKQLLKAQR